MTVSLCDRVENTVGKEENAGYQYFLLFPMVFSEAIFFKVIKLCGQDLNNPPDASNIAIYVTIMDP